MFAERCPEISLEWLTRGQGVMLVGADMIDTPGHVDLGGNKRGVLVRPTVKTKRRVDFAELRNRALMRSLVRVYGHYGQDGSPMTETIKAILQETSKQDVEAKKKSAKKTQAKKAPEEIGKRKQNEILKEALFKVASELKVEDGKLKFSPYTIKGEDGVAVLPIQRKAELYFEVKGMSMSPSINEGDVVGVVSTDWFEVFSPNNIYLLILLSGELMIRRIVQPENHSDDYITLKSDNPEEPEMQIQRRQIADIKRVCYVGKNL